MKTIQLFKPSEIEGFLTGKRLRKVFKAFMIIKNSISVKLLSAKIQETEQATNAVLKTLIEKKIVKREKNTLGIYVYDLNYDKDVKTDG